MKTQTAKLNPGSIDQTLFSRITLAQHLEILSILFRYKNCSEELLKEATNKLYGGNILDFFASKIFLENDDDLSYLLELINSRLTKEDIKGKTNKENLRNKKNIKTELTKWLFNILDKDNKVVIEYFEKNFSDNAPVILKTTNNTSQIENECGRFLHTIFFDCNNKDAAKKIFKTMFLKLIEDADQEHRPAKLDTLLVPVLELSLSTKIITYQDIADTVPHIRLEIMQDNKLNKEIKRQKIDDANYLVCELGLSLKNSIDQANNKDKANTLLDSIISDSLDRIKNENLKNQAQQTIKYFYDSRSFNGNTTDHVVKAYEEKNLDSFISAIILSGKNFNNICEKLQEKYGKDPFLIMMLCIAQKAVIALYSENDEKDAITQNDKEIISTITETVEKLSQEKELTEESKFIYTAFSAFMSFYKTLNLTLENAEETFSYINQFLSEQTDETFIHSMKGFFMNKILEHCATYPTEENYQRAQQYLTLENYELPNSVLAYKNIALNAMFYLQYGEYKKLNDELAKINSITLKNIGTIGNEDQNINKLNNILAKVYLTYANKLLKENPNNKKIDKLLKKAAEILDLLKEEADSEIELLQISIEQLQGKSSLISSKSDSDDDLKSQKNKEVQEEEKISDEQPATRPQNSLRIEIDAAIEKNTEKLISQLANSNYAAKTEAPSEPQSWTFNHHEYTSSQNAYPTQIPNVYAMLSEETTKDLDPDSLKKAQEALSKGLARSKTGDTGIKMINKILELKIFGSNGQGDVRYFCDKCIVNANGKKLYVFDRIGSHKSEMLKEMEFFSDTEIPLQSDSTKVFSNPKMQQKQEYLKQKAFEEKQTFIDFELGYYVNSHEDTQTMGEGQNETMKLVSDFQ